MYINLHIINPFLTCRHILMHLPLMTFENILAWGEVTHGEQFLLLPHCFQPWFNNHTSTFIYIDSPYFCRDVFKVVCIFVVSMCGKHLSSLKNVCNMTHCWSERKWYENLIILYYNLSLCWLSVFYNDPLLKGKKMIQESYNLIL